MGEGRGKGEVDFSTVFSLLYFSYFFSKIFCPQFSSFFSEFFQGQRQAGRNCLVIQGKRLLHSAAIDWYTAARLYSGGNVQALFTHQ